MSESLRKIYLCALNPFLDVRVKHVGFGRYHASIQDSMGRFSLQGVILRPSDAWWEWDGQ